MKQQWFASWFFYRNNNAKVEGYNTFEEDASLNGEEVHDKYLAKIASNYNVSSEKIILISFNKI
ncbi:hypothetical protein P2W49_11680 [Yersinia intermedia]|nr:hypothetical protein P2W49_11680 [Yersinia intermedia]